MTKYSIATARNRLPALVHEVENGPAVELTRRGRPVAVLLSVSEYRNLQPQPHDFLDAVLSFRADQNLADLDAEDVWDAVRDRSTGLDPLIRARG